MTKAELYQKACMLPLLPGVYIIRDKTDTIIYIGKAKRLRIRVSQYFREGVPHDNKVSQMIAHAYAFDVIVCQSEFEALVLEASQIKAHTPKYNILLKDDKGYLRQPQTGIADIGHQSLNLIVQSRHINSLNQIIKRKRRLFAELRQQIIAAAFRIRAVQVKRKNGP